MRCSWLVTITFAGTSSRTMVPMLTTELSPMDTSGGDHRLVRDPYVGPHDDRTSLDRSVWRPAIEPRDVEVRGHHRARSDHAAVTDRDVVGRVHIESVDQAVLTDADRDRHPDRVDEEATRCNLTGVADDDATLTTDLGALANPHPRADRDVAGRRDVARVDPAPVPDRDAAGPAELDAFVDVHRIADRDVAGVHDVQGGDVAPVPDLDSTSLLDAESPTNVYPGADRHAVGRHDVDAVETAPIAEADHAGALGVDRHATGPTAEHAAVADDDAPRSPEAQRASRFHPVTPDDPPPVPRPVVARPGVHENPRLAPRDDPAPKTLADRSKRVGRHHGPPYDSRTGSSLERGTPSGRGGT